MTPDSASPGSASSLDRAKCHKLIEWSARVSRLPGSEQYQEIAAQLKLALFEIDGADTRIDRAQNETLRYQRELEIANVEVRQLRAELIARRASVEQPAPAGAASGPKKRGPRAKIVPISTQAAAQ